MVDVAVQDRRGALRRHRRQPRVLCADDTVGGHERERPSAGALAEQHAQRGRIEHHQLGKTSGYLTGQAALLGLLAQRSPGGVDDADPVSYTHLRAHETDSYLVCRLLLEKKKKINKIANKKKE